MSQTYVDFLSVLRQNQSINCRTINVLLENGFDTNDALNALDFNLDLTQMTDISRTQKLKLKQVLTELKNSLNCNEFWFRFCENEALSHGNKVNRVFTSNTFEKSMEKFQRFQSSNQSKDEQLNDSTIDNLNNNNDWSQTTDESTEEEECDSYEDSVNKYIKPQTKGFSCEYDKCGKKFTKKFYVTEHIYRHLGLKPYKCKLKGCQYRCDAMAAMRRHIRPVHQLITKATENQIYKNEEIVENYIKDGFECGFKNCGKKFSASRDLKCHIRRHLALKPFKCTHKGCDYTCVSRRDILPHTRKQHQSIEGLKCEDCGLSLKTRFDMQNHKYKAHTNRCFKCEECGKPFTQRLYLRVHMKRHISSKQFRCHFEGCLYVGLLIPELNRHIMNVHQKLEQSLDCNECGLSFETKFHYYSHKLKSHSKEDEFKCRKCDKSFKTEYNYNLHQLRHSNSKRFKCNVKGCLYKGLVLKDLSRHIQHIHTHIPGLRCKKCNKSFDNKFQLMAHRSKKHVERHFQCTQCHKIHLSKELLLRHIKREHKSTEKESQT